MAIHRRLGEVVRGWLSPGRRENCVHSCAWSPCRRVVVVACVIGFWMSGRFGESRYRNGEDSATQMAALK
jgi:hypothetical protein